MMITRGEVQLSLGTATVSHSRIPAGAVVSMTPRSLLGTIGNLRYSVVAGASFTIQSNNVLDTSIIGYTVTI